MAEYDRTIKEIRDACSHLNLKYRDRLRGEIKRIENDLVKYQIKIPIMVGVPDNRARISTISFEKRNQKWSLLTTVNDEYTIRLSRANPKVQMVALEYIHILLEKLLEEIKGITEEMEKTERILNSKKGSDDDEEQKLSKVPRI